MQFSNGEDLSIIITCEYQPHHNWMSFASWYSLSKCLPDAQVTIAVVRGYPSRELFVWPARYGAKLIQHESTVAPSDLVQTDRKKLCISPTVVAVRDFGGILGPVSAKSDILATLVDYSEGCGRFVMTEWINKVVPPFDRAGKRFATGEMTANEVAILKLWGRIASLHTM
jgi:hypothetical protein